MIHFKGSCTVAGLDRVHGKTSREENGSRRLLPQKCQKKTLKTLITSAIELIHLQEALRSTTWPVPLKKKGKKRWPLRNFEWSTVTSTWRSKWPSTSFSEQRIISSGKKKRACQREGSGVLNHRSLRILKHLPEWKPKTFIGRLKLSWMREESSQRLIAWGEKSILTSFVCTASVNRRILGNMSVGLSCQRPHHSAGCGCLRFAAFFYILNETLHMIPIKAGWELSNVLCWVCVCLCAC